MSNSNLPTGDDIDIDVSIYTWFAIFSCPVDIEVVPVEEVVSIPTFFSLILFYLAHVFYQTSSLVK
jgi:hypothetical protein